MPLGLSDFPTLWACAVLGLVLIRHAAPCVSADVSRINVALHAQVPPSAGFVVGSAVTMAGVRQALLDRERREPPGSADGGEIGIFSAAVEVAHTQTFYPFEYAGLHDRPWDLVIIEGWFQMINAFIHEVWLCMVSQCLVYFDPCTCSDRL